MTFARFQFEVILSEALEQCLKILKRAVKISRPNQFSTKCRRGAGGAHRDRTVDGKSSLLSCALPKQSHNGSEKA